MDKAPDAFRTISEVAEDLDIPQHVLRFWESRFAQIKPMKRAGGRRYYRPDDVALLRGIRHLLYGEGYTIRGVQRILKDQGARFVQTAWEPGATIPADPEAMDTGTNVRAEPVFDEPAPAMADREHSPMGDMGVRARRDTDVQALTHALEELRACRRILEAAWSESAADAPVGVSA